jgi:hypothetical protein
MHGGVTGKAREGLPMSIGIGFATMNQWSELPDSLILYLYHGLPPIGIGSMGVLFSPLHAAHLIF